MTLFHFHFILLVSLSDSNFFICIRYNDSVSRGHIAISFVQICTFLLVTLMHLGKQDFVNSLTILYLHVYVNKLN